MKFGSLFSGILGMDQGLESAGCELSWVSEIEAFPCQLIAHHRPGIPNLGDITKVHWDDVEPVDLICAGFPCQPFSVAGKRKSSADSRNLWPSTRDAVAWIQPDYFMGENTPGLLSAPASFPERRLRNYKSLGEVSPSPTPKPPVDRYFGTILRNLCELGYNVEWVVVSANDVGAPQKRERVFIVAHRSETKPPVGPPFAVLEREFWVKPVGGLLVWMDVAPLRERRYRENWPKFGAMVNGKAYRLPPLEKESQCTTSHNWPTPNTLDYLGQRSPEAREYQLRRGDPDGSRRSTTGNLREDAAMWATPRASPNENRTTKATPSQADGRRGEYLAVQAAETKDWPTPKANDCKQGGKAELNRRAPRLAATVASSNPSPAADSGTTGSSSPPRESLAVPFVESLQGFPPGWTEIPEGQTLQIGLRRLSGITKAGGRRKSPKAESDQHPSAKQ